MAQRQISDQLAELYALRILRFYRFGFMVLFAIAYGIAFAIGFGILKAFLATYPVLIIIAVFAIVGAPIACGYCAVILAYGDVGEWLEDHVSSGWTENDVVAERYGPIRWFGWIVYLIFGLIALYCLFWTLFISAPVGVALAWQFASRFIGAPPAWLIQWADRILGSFLG